MAICMRGPALSTLLADRLERGWRWKRRDGKFAGGARGGHDVRVAPESGPAIGEVLRWLLKTPATA
jgi:hypothetical protein